MASQKYTCNECDWKGMHDDLLIARNPFCDDEQIVGCPKCRSPESMVLACEHDGCWKDAGCGTPIPGGYAQTCFTHRPPTPHDGGKE